MPGVLLPSAGSDRPGIWLPPEFGQWWKPKRNAAGSAKATVALVGDSITRGMYASNPETKSWAALLRASLQAQYGDGGSGFKSVTLTDLWLANANTPAAVRTAYAAQLSPVTGAWTVFNGAGPGSAAIYSQTAGDTITFTRRGTSVSVYHLKSGTSRSFDWTVHGVPQPRVNANGANGVANATPTGLSDGTHTSVVTIVGGANVFICGASGEKATGVVVNNFGRPGGVSANFDNTDSFGGNASWSGGANYPADLVIYALGVNDGFNNVTGDAYAKAVRRALTAIRDQADPRTDVLMVLNHVGKWDATNAVYQDYVARARGLAQSFGAGLVDFWRLGRNSYSYWQALGYFAVADGSGAAGADNVHLSDAGFQYMHDTLLPIIAA